MKEREREREKGRVSMHTCSEVSFLFIEEIQGAMSSVWPVLLL